MMLRCSVCGYADTALGEAAFCPGCGVKLSDGEPTPAVELVSISKSFHGHVVLKELSLSVAQGESLVIVGTSGSGKSVLLEHIIGFQRPDSGTVRIFGESVVSGHSRRLGPSFGMVFQGSALVDSLTVRENVKLPLDARSIDAQDSSRRASELIQAVGLSPGDGDLLPAQLSGGMQKRVGIARALIHRPSILLYDEPTTGLDAATSLAISQLMRDVQESDSRLTSITITHDYLSCGVIADRVLYLNRETGQLDVVLSREQIVEIRDRHRDEFAVRAEIRGILEAYFSRIARSEKPSASQTPSPQWAEAFGNVIGATFGLIGTAMLLLARVGRSLDGQAIVARMYTFGFQSLLVIAAAGAFVGMMLAHQIGRVLADTGFTDPLPRIVGLTVVDKVGPLVVGLLMAGRLGASVSAEIGGKRHSQQFDALRAMGIFPERFWLAPILWATLMVMPLLTLVLEAAALTGAYAVSVMRYHINSSLFLDRVLDDVSLPSLLFGFLRSTVFGIVIVLIAFAKGAEEKRSSDEIGRATTIAVAAASVAVIVVDFVLVFVVPD